jgi:hypothetical protein
MPGYTKRELVLDAYDEVGLASYAFNLKPAQIERAVRKLDRAMGVLVGKGVQVGYPLTNSTAGLDVTVETNLPVWATEGVVLGLGISLATGLGKQIPMELRSRYKEAMAVIFDRSDNGIPEMQRQENTPAGMGNMYRAGYIDPFLSDPDEAFGPDNGSQFDF